VVEVLHLPHPKLLGLLRGGEHFCTRKQRQELQRWGSISKTPIQHALLQQWEAVPSGLSNCTTPLIKPLPPATADPCDLPAFRQKHGNQRPASSSSSATCALPPPKSLRVRTRAEPCNACSHAAGQLPEPPLPPQHQDHGHHFTYQE
jgi:hypothetical protein